MFSVVGMSTLPDLVHARFSLVLSAIALAVMLYALYTFHWRAAAIRKRSTAPYDDRVGPVRRIPTSEKFGTDETIYPFLDYPVHRAIRHVLLNLDSRTFRFTYLQRPSSSTLSFGSPKGSPKDEGIGVQFCM